MDALEDRAAFHNLPERKEMFTKEDWAYSFFVVLSEHMVAAVYQKSKDGRPMKQALALVKYNPARWNKKTKDHGLWEVEFPTDQHFAGYAWMAKLLELRDAVEQWNIAIAMKKKKQREKEEAERLEVING